MKKFFRQLHLWLGLPAAAVLLVVAVTGALLVFEKDLDRPSLPVISGVAPMRSLEELSVTAKAHLPDAQLRQVRLYREGEPVEFRFDRGRQLWMSSVDGSVLAEKKREGSFFDVVTKIHTELVAGKTGQWIVGVSSIFLLALMGTGLVLWWPKQWRMLKQAIKPDVSKKGRALHFNLHNTLGFWSAPPLLFIALTGAIMAFKPIGDGLRLLGGGGKPRVPEATSVRSRPPASLDKVALTARGLFPDSRELRLHFPNQGKKAKIETMDDEGKRLPVWRIESISADTPHDHARSLAYLDPRSGDVLDFRPFDARAIGERLRALARPIHDGSIFGRPTQLIALFAVLVLPVLSVTGVVLWWMRTRSASARAKNHAKAVLPVAIGAPRAA